MRQCSRCPVYPDCRNQLGFVFLIQNEELSIQGIPTLIPADEINSVVDEIVCFSGLGAFINLPMRTYSSGMVMRLLFSISTCINSDILIMDEWLSVGDEDFLNKAQKRLMDLISKLYQTIQNTNDEINDLIKKLD